MLPKLAIFLSTPSARRATVLCGLSEQLVCDFYPRPPRGGRRYYSVSGPNPIKFLSTPSARRATSACPALVGSAQISIHALREEGDPCIETLFCVASISIHALREEGDAYARASPMSEFHFYPRPPRGGRPGQHSGAKCNHHISIHALREEGDGLQLVNVQRRKHFYPRPPRGGRHKSQKV